MQCGGSGGKIGNFYVVLSWEYQNKNYNPPSFSGKKIQPPPPTTGFPDPPPPPGNKRPLPELESLEERQKKTDLMESLLSFTKILIKLRLLSIDRASLISAFLNWLRG